MDLLNFFLEDRTINIYLKQNPKPSWPTILKRIIVYGIYSIRALDYSGLPSRHSDRHTLRHHRKPSTRILSDEADRRTSRERTKGRSHCRTARGDSKVAPRGTQYKTAPRCQIPKYLANVDSKIKRDVQKDKLACKQHRIPYQMPNGHSKRPHGDIFKENDVSGWLQQNKAVAVSATPKNASGSFLWNELPVQDTFSDSSSSLSSAHPPSEMREFQKLVPDEIPRRLEPIELPLDANNRLPSHSAQFLSESSDRGP